MSVAAAGLLTVLSAHGSLAAPSAAENTDRSAVAATAQAQPAAAGTQQLPPLLTPREAQRIAASPDPLKAAKAADAYRIKNDNSGKCLVAQGSANDTPAIQFNCATFQDQYWIFSGSSFSNVQLVNANSGKCLLVRGGNDGSVAVQYQCADYADQKWDVRFDPNGNGHFMLANRNSGKCLVGQNNGSNPFQFSCNNGFQDQWWHNG
ncbi:RICIN domain-containing protein [Streptomyces youssoufiensis]